MADPWWQHLAAHLLFIPIKVESLLASIKLRRAAPTAPETAWFVRGSRNGYQEVPSEEENIG